MIFVGTSIGKIFVVDLSERAISLSAAHAETFTLGDSFKRGSLNKSQQYMTIAGHSSAVTSLVVSVDNLTLVSVSSDCTMKIWDVVTRQCIRESKPFVKLSLSNVSFRLHFRVCHIIDKLRQ